jgi:hypothetical protein
MASSLIVLRQRIASAIQGAFEAFRGEVTPVVQDRVQPFLAEGEAGLDFDLLQQVLNRMVAASFQQLVTADKAHDDELANDVGPRTRRDEAVANARRKLIEIRGLATHVFGPTAAGALVAIDGSTAYEPELLWRQAEHTLSRLEDAELVLPAPASAAVTFDRAAYAAELAPLVTALRQVIDGVELDRRIKATSLKTKHDAMEEHDLLMGACGRIFSGLCLLARRRDLASRIRIRFPNRGTAEDVPSDAAPDGPAPDGPAGDAPPPGESAPASPDSQGSRPAAA